jgi:uncharacterized protein YjbJ (UPF0337 family)
MATEDKAASKAKQAKGKIKKKAGKVTDNPKLKARGSAEETRGNLKEGVEKVKDAAKK